MSTEDAESNPPENLTSLVLGESFIDLENNCITFKNQGASFQKGIRFNV